ncbi:hypothetical protein RYX36_034664 [Vicia faba]
MHIHKLILTVICPIELNSPSLYSSLLLFSTLQASTSHAVNLKTTSSFLYDLFEEDEDGEWFNANTEAIIAQALQTWGGPNVSEAYIINGLSGPLYNCSKKAFTLAIQMPVARCTLCTEQTVGARDIICAGHVDRCMVPDLGDFVATGDDQTVTKRRKAAEDDDNDSDKETKRNKMVFFRVIALFSTVVRYLVKNGCA